MSKVSKVSRRVRGCADHYKGRRAPFTLQFPPFWFPNLVTLLLLISADMLSVIPFFLLALTGATNAHPTGHDHGHNHG
jgi:hypothetical protein